MSYRFIFALQIYEIIFIRQTIHSKKIRKNFRLVKKLVFSSGFLMKNSRFLEFFTDFQTLKS